MLLVDFEKQWFSSSIWTAKSRKQVLKIIYLCSTSINEHEYE